MAQSRSTAIACGPVVPNRLPFSTMGSGFGDQLISELLTHGRLHPPAHVSDFQSFMSHVVKLAKILTGAGGSAIALRGQQGTICEARCGEGAPPLGSPVDTGSGISKQCLESGISLRCEDIATDGRVDSEMCLAAGIHALAVVPIYSDGEISGILEVFSSTPGVFNDQHLRRLEMLANWLGSAPAMLSENVTNAGAQLPIHPDITLLIELEPAYRVFFRNLADLARRQLPANSTVSSRQFPGWNPVFVDSHVPWKRFFESVFLHLVAVGIVAAGSRIYPRELVLSPPRIQEALVMYPPFSQSFPARDSSPPAESTRPPESRQRIKREGDRSADSDGLSAEQQREKPVLTAPLPAMPMFGTIRFQKSGLEAAAPVAPAPVIDGPNSRQSSLPGSSVVAPPPDLGNGVALRRFNAPGVAAVPPSPELSGSTAKTGQNGAGRVGSSSAGAPEVAIVQPAPALNDRPLLSYGTVGPRAQSGEQVVGPPPTVQSLGKIGAGGTALSSGGAASEVVPPPPSLEGGNSFGAGPVRPLGVGSSQIVPPPPSVQDGGNVSGGNVSAGTRISSLASAGSHVVPPPPSVPTSGGDSSGATARTNAVAPFGAGVVLPPASTEIAFESKPGTPKAAKDAERSPSAAEANKNSGSSTIQELPLRVIGLAWAPARSSYFSNFEVFLAERWLNKDRSQFIKLVYVFLPYQERLSEYGFDSKVRKLRVTRDSTCDERLAEIASSRVENRPPGSPSVDSLASISADGDSMLPCYRTTADDYRRAISRSK